MKRLCMILALLPAPGLADDCRDHVAALFDGGALDPFATPPHALETTTYGPDGVVRYVYHGRIETPVRMVGGIDGGTMALIVGNDSWMGPSLDGPWTAAPNMVPADHEGFVRTQTAQKVANLDRVDCAGVVDLDGAPREKLEFFTKTDPNDAVGGAWFGGMNTVYIDPETGQVARWDTYDSVAHYQADPSPDRQVSLRRYDAEISVNAPD